MPATSNNSILIVDEQAMFVDLLVATLSSPELSVIGSGSVSEAGKALERNLFDLVILGADLPDIFSLITKLHAQTVPSQIIAIASSADRFTDLEARGVAVVYRNAGLNELLAAIKRTIHLEVDLPENTQDMIRILVADDEEEVRSMLSQFLKVRGYAVRFATNGSEAVEFVRKDPGIRIVLLDVNMPEMDGLEALALITSTEKFPQVIMLTSAADEETGGRAINAGAFDYILKPFDFPTIEASIVAALSQLEYHQQPWWKNRKGVTKNP